MEFELPNLQEKKYCGKRLDIILCSKESSKKEQIGYSVKPNGEPLYGFDDGDWQEGWYVIGRESLCGDPIFIDLNDPEIPVYTAMHGSGAWVEKLLASSYEHFIDLLNGNDVFKPDSSLWDFFFDQ